LPCVFDLDAALMLAYNFYLKVHHLPNGTVLWEAGQK